MSSCQITAIINRNVLVNVETALQQAGVSGITVTKVKGFGEYADFFARDWMSPHVRVEILTSTDRADALVQTIIAAAHTGLAGDGIVAVTPVDIVWRIRTRAPAGAARE